MRIADMLFTAVQYVPQTQKMKENENINTQRELIRILLDLEIAIR